MIAMTHVLRETLNNYIKSRRDISDLIKDVSIKGEDLSFSIIKNFMRINDDISNSNLKSAIIGDENNITQIIRCNMQNCNWEGIKFLGRTWVRSCDARGSNFRKADISKVDYAHTDFRNCQFCETIMTIGTNQGIGCIFDENLFEALSKGWGIKVKVEPKEIK